MHFYRSQTLKDSSTITLKYKAHSLKQTECCSISCFIPYSVQLILKNISSHVWCINIHIHFERQKISPFYPDILTIISFPYLSLFFLSHLFFLWLRSTSSLVSLVAKNHPRIFHIHINTSHTFSCSSFFVNSSCNQKIHVKLAVVCRLMQCFILFN